MAPLCVFCRGMGLGGGGVCVCVVGIVCLGVCISVVSDIDHH